MQHKRDHRVAVYLNIEEAEHLDHAVTVLRLAACGLYSASAFRCFQQHKRSTPKGIRGCFARHAAIKRPP